MSQPLMPPTSPLPSRVLGFNPRMLNARSFDWVALLTTAIASKSVAFRSLRRTALTASRCRRGSARTRRELGLEPFHPPEKPRACSWHLA